MPVMSGFRVGLGNEIVNSRYSATAFARPDYLTAAGGPAYHPAGVRVNGSQFGFSCAWCWSLD